MPYIVEIRRKQADLGKTMSDIREWLDTQHFEPDAFRYAAADNGVTFRLEFRNQSEAAACAEAFGGRFVSER
jgi:hypothetical protein